MRGVLVASLGALVVADEEPLPRAAHLSGAGSVGSSLGTCNLQGLWNFAPVRTSPHTSGWPPQPHTYNITHDVASGAVSFDGFAFKGDLTWRPGDDFSRAVGSLLPSGQLLLTLQDVGRRPGETLNVTGTVHHSCDFIDMEGAPYACTSAPKVDAVSPHRSLLRAELLKLDEAADPTRARMSQSLVCITALIRGDFLTPRFVDRRATS
eukprot:COSAG02_NODE_295_length_25421_cov_88.063226_10_plen_208_part_00